MLARAPWIVVDGAHTAASARALAAALAALPRAATHLVLSISAGKDLAAILDALLPLADQVTVTRAEAARSLDPAEVAAAVRAARPGLALRVVPNPHLALRAAREVGAARRTPRRDRLDLSRRASRAGSGARRATDHRDLTRVAQHADHDAGAEAFVRRRRRRRAVRARARAPRDRRLSIERARRRLVISKFDGRAAREPQRAQPREQRALVVGESLCTLRASRRRAFASSVAGFSRHAT